MNIETFITQMPKVELHVHLEGSTRPETLLKLAARHAVPLPAEDVDGLRRWYTFRDFDHFIEIYMTISGCLRTAEDIELIAREFLTGQAEQNILYSEVTFTPYNQLFNNGLDFHVQIEAVNRARRWAEDELGVRMGMIIDIPRVIPPAEGDRMVGWVIDHHGDGVVALGLGGPEVGHPPEKYRAGFELARDAGLPCILHAGETAGPESIWSALRIADSRRIGHGVRAIEDPQLVAYLKEKQIPLEVCPTSNICLKVYPSLQEHSLPPLLEAGLYITLNSDDPPMFNTTLTEEYLHCQQAYGWDRTQIEHLLFNAVEASLLPDFERAAMRADFKARFSALQ